MARSINRLSSLAVVRLSEIGRHADGGNLYLSISSNGGRRWVFLFRWHGKPTEMGLGSVNAINLKQARELAATARSQVAMGVNPLAEKRKRRAHVPTFGECAESFIEINKSEWRNDKHIAQWSSTLRTYAEPIWELAINDIETADILKILKPICSTKAETASRVRGRMERVFASATTRGLRTGENPAQWRNHLENELPKRKKLSRGHHAALDFKDVPSFMATLSSQQGTAARALEAAILTGTRTSEILNASWDEIDFQANTWTIPAVRMKAAKEHRVPLAKRSMEILKAANDDSSGDYVFKGAKSGKPLSNMAMAELLKRMGVDVTVHGFRSSFRDWISETTNYPNEVAEAALAHSIKNAVEASYRRGDLFQKRRELMIDWDIYCSGGASRNA